MSQQNETIIRRVNEAFSTDNMHNFVDLLAEEFTWNMNGEIYTDKTALLSSLESMGMMPPVITVERILTSGDGGFAEGTVTMTKVAGEPITSRYCDTYLFKDGKIKELKSYVVGLNKSK